MNTNIRRADWRFSMRGSRSASPSCLGSPIDSALWRGRNVGYGNFDGFIRYTAKVNSFMPASSIRFLAWVPRLRSWFSASCC